MPCFQVLNRILKHMRIGKDQPYTQDFLDTVPGYDGTYSVALIPSEEEAVRQLRKAMDKPLRDLDKLLTVHGIDAAFQGLPTEI
jgi:hypothetical protein